MCVCSAKQSKLTSLAIWHFGQTFKHCCMCFNVRAPRRSSSSTASPASASALEPTHLTANVLSACKTIDCERARENNNTTRIMCLTYGGGGRTGELIVVPVNLNQLFLSFDCMHDNKPIARAAGEVKLISCTRVRVHCNSLGPSARSLCVCAIISRENGS